MADTVIRSPFRGNRDYLQAADMLDAMVDVIGRPLHDLLFTVHEMIRTDRLALKAVDAAGLKSCQVRLVARDGEGGVLTYGLTPLPASDQPKRLPNDEEIIRAAAQLDGLERNSWTGAAPLSTLSVAVALKKSLLEKRFPEVTGKWIFCRLQAPALLRPTEGIVSVQFNRASRNIFVSDVFVEGRHAAEMTFMNN